MGSSNFIIGTDKKDQNDKVNSVRVNEDREISTNDSYVRDRNYAIQDTLNCILMELKEVVKQLKKINK
jgi:hypothetical protein